MQPYLAALSRWNDFAGRSGRGEAWGFGLVVAATFLVPAWADARLPGGDDPLAFLADAVRCLQLVALPALATRRARDAGLPPWLGVVPAAAALSVLALAWSGWGTSPAAGIAVGILGLAATLPRRGRPDAAEGITPRCSCCTPSSSHHPSRSS
jgi:uncharacterized membrane protein YhaH (DUF805 family)